MRIKNVICVLLVLCLIGPALFGVKVHAAVVESGSCNTNVNWSLSSDGVLTLSGKGTMKLASWYMEPPWLKHNEKITKAVIGSGITDICDKAFSWCINLKTVSIPDTVTAIGAEAFAYCESLSSVTISNYVTSIGNSAFTSCKALTNMTFPESVITYGYGILENCGGITKVTLPDNMLFIPGSMFASCGSLESIDLPESIREIQGKAFSGCSKIKSITIPNAVKKIGDDAFSNCLSLEKITLPENLVEIGTGVFENIRTLTSVTIPGKVTTMRHTFQYAYGLKEVKFIGNAPLVNSHLFLNVTAKVYYPSNNNSWTEAVRQNYGGTVTWIPYESDYVADSVIARGTLGPALSWELSSDNVLTISGEGTMVGGTNNVSWRQYNSKIEKVIIEAGVTDIAASCFYDCRMITSVSIPDTVTRIYDSAFGNCVSLRKVTIPASVTRIDNAFSGCIGMSSITFFGNAPHIGEMAFRELTLDAYYPEGNTTWTASKLKNYGGTVAWSTGKKQSEPVSRIYGADRYQTAFEVAEVLKESRDTVEFDSIIVASGTGFADALSGTYLATKIGAPIVLVRGQNVVQVKAFIKKNLKNGGTLYLLGGSMAVPSMMEYGMETYNVKRLGGANRYETNMTILKEQWKDGMDIFVCTGNAFADSLSVSALGKPILLVGSSLSLEQKELLKKCGNIYIIGGTGAVSDKVEAQLKQLSNNVVRIGGTTRYDTSVKVAEYFYKAPEKVVLAYGENFPDGLSGGVLAAEMDAPLILTSTAKYKTAAAYVQKVGVKEGYIIGGPTLISDTAARNIYALSAAAVIG